LRHVFRLCGIPEHVNRQPVDSLLVSANQGPKGLGVTPLGGLDQLTVALVRHSVPLAEALLDGRNTVRGGSR
jgi:hypothetical protein